MDMASPSLTFARDLLKHNLVRFIADSVNNSMCYCNSVIVIVHMRGLDWIGGDYNMF